MPHPAMPDRAELKKALVGIQKSLIDVERILGAAREHLPDGPPVNRLDTVLAKRHDEALRYARETTVTVEMIGSCFAIDPEETPNA